MDKALTLAHKTGRPWTVCEIGQDKDGRPVLYDVFTA
jgi:hypothetical protein